jgi:hypothetical protein
MHGKGFPALATLPGERVKTRVAISRGVIFVARAEVITLQCQRHNNIKVLVRSPFYGRLKYL